MPFDDFREVTKLTEAFARAQTAHHLNLDRAGIQNAGHMIRVVHDDVAITPEEKRARGWVTDLIIELTLQELLDDPVYLKRWEEFGQFLATYSEATRTALARASDTLEAARTAVERALSNAHTLDGQPIFDAGDGRYVFADGSDIPADSGDRIVWNNNAVSYDEYLERVRAQNAAEQRVAEVQDYLDQLNAAEQRRHDPDHHYNSTGEMDADQERFKIEIPDAVDEVLQASPTARTITDDNIMTAGKITLGS